MFRVIENFCDKQDNYWVYGRGDEFPRPGLEVTDERLKELSSDKNRLKRPLIEEVEIAATVKGTRAPTGKPAKKAKKG